MPAKTSVNPDSGKLSVYEKMVASNREIERKGDTIPYTSLNGHMFSLLTKDGEIGLRLSRDDRDNFLEKYPDSILIQYGIVMKEYVKMPVELFSKPKELRKYFDQSYDYVKTLKPKLTAKSKKPGKKK